MGTVSGAVLLLVLIMVLCMVLVAVAAAVAVAAPPELAAGAGAGEPAATDETAPVTVDDGDRPRLKTMLSREMDLRAEVRLETGTRR